MAQSEQSYANHKKFYPLWHYFVFPVLLLNFLAQLWTLSRAPSWSNAWTVVIAFALATLAFTGRVMSLTVQNRLIRLEEQLRFGRLLPPDLQARASGLRTGQLVALRFASDAEIPALVRRCLDGELTTSDQIKRSIKEWRADTLRA